MSKVRIAIRKKSSAGYTALERMKQRFPGKKNNISEYNWNLSQLYCTRLQSHVQILQPQSYALQYVL